ncbi:MAG: hypothetical protein JW986_04990 [Methanotrichaceae archaeon]|nr:hypothetical protein [Methanotrichaceae archaeon]
MISAAGSAWEEGYYLVTIDRSQFGDPLGLPMWRGLACPAACGGCRAAVV